MKQIGHIDGGNSASTWRTHSLGMLSPHELFIPNPGERENVNAEQWLLVGWITPDTDGGVVCPNHLTAGSGCLTQHTAIHGELVIRPFRSRLPSIADRDRRRTWTSPEYFHHGFRICPIFGPSDDARLTGERISETGDFIALPFVAGR